MRVRGEGRARIRHRISGEIHDIDWEDLDWDVVGSEDRGMGAENHHEAVLEHPDLGVLKWGLWEYPLGVENREHTDVGAHEIVEDFVYGLEHVEPEPDDWIDYRPPDDPYSVFLDSYERTCELLTEQGGEDGNDVVNRMVFSHQVTAMEAYLGDTLTNEVIRDPDALQRLIQMADGLKDRKFSLLEIAGSQDLVLREVVSYLRAQIYHNLKKVDVLYNIALEVRPLMLAKDRSNLLKAIKLRHDCVHRNGVDKDGNKLNLFTTEFVQDAADLIRDYVNAVDHAVGFRHGF